ncbi:MAG: T9SS type A sorting domain-containing protein [Saprospiraceae bacterium]|nr:T9SS type A sorting domain-containing protein [Saprospiraceae bacterium]
MRQFLLLLSLLYATATEAQIKWLETGQQWEFCMELGWVGSFGCDTLTVVGDTVIAGKPCKKMRGTKGYFRYAYEISDKVFISENGSSFQKVYDFDMIEGETLDVGLFTYQVDSIQVVDLGDFTGVRVQKAHVVGAPYRGFSTFYIAEGIGFIKSLQSEWQQCVCGYFFLQNLSCDFFIDGLNTHLVSFKQDDKIFRPADTLNCEGGISTHAPAYLENVRIEPNPVATTCRLSHSLPFSDGVLTLFNIAGIPVRQWKGLPEMLDMTNCLPGLYFLVLHRDGQVVFRNKVVKQ